MKDNFMEHSVMYKSFEMIEHHPHSEEFVIIEKSDFDDYDKEQIDCSQTSTGSTIENILHSSEPDHPTLRTENTNPLQPKEDLKTIQPLKKHLNLPQEENILHTQTSVYELAQRISDIVETDIKVGKIINGIIRDSQVKTFQTEFYNYAPVPAPVPVLGSALILS